ncbi:ACT domain-containing protein ACR10-like isoform X1 [Zingiber officinale]|uniref:ACT domain-containing protein ACR10-like isoform X1 n=1 Tax=Zingiber officinale TaxID=94328 RepID=UPI001C4D06C9|nr:ACT domain-containing protein ACR10-like isoform X1 [Zingiber officinale]
MGIPSDEVVIIRPPESPGGPSLITVSCPDKTGLGCDLCRVILLFGLSIVRGDFSTDGRWCYVLLWVAERGRKETRWDLLKKRLVAVCPSVSPPLVSEINSSDQEMDAEQKPQVFLLKFSCYDRMGLLHDVTEVLCELELTIRRVKVSTTPDGTVMDLFLITDTRELLHTQSRREDACNRLRAILGDSMCSCEIELASEEIASCLQASSSLPPSITEDMLTLEIQDESSNAVPQSSFLSVSVDNSLSHAHSLIQIQCYDHKGLLYDIMRTLKDYNMQVSYGRFNTKENGNCNVDLLVVQNDGKKIVDPNKQVALCSRLRMELSSPLRVTLVSRGPDIELLVANPVEICGKGRPLVFYDITYALKLLEIRIFLAEIGRHVIGDREWEVYRVHLGDDHELCASKDKIVDGVTKMLMGWH